MSREKKRFLEGNRAAFLFGNVAPDVQVISGQPRQDTHFFSLPSRPGQLPPVAAVQAAYPQLLFSHQMPASKAAFLVGYYCHLQADYLWVQQIFSPIFGQGGDWAPIEQRLELHNVLRAYVDRQVRPQLDSDTAAWLALAEPRQWLPFVDDHNLCLWRDCLQPQLEPHAESQTVEVFAARQGIPPEQYYRLLGSEDRMEQEVFSYLSRQQLDHYTERLFAESEQLVHLFFDPSLPGAYSRAAAGVVIP